MERLESRIISRLESSAKEPVLWWQGEWWKGKDLEILVRSCTKSLERSGFSEGDRLAVLLPNSPMVLALSIATWRLGGTISTLNAKAGQRSLLGTLDLISPQAVVLSEDMGEMGDEILRAGFPVVQTPLGGPLPEYSGRTSEKSDPQLAIIFATSGTTGLPKAVPLSHTNLIDNATKVFDFVEELEEGDVMINVLPNFHSFGYTVSGIMPLICGMSQTILPNFMPPRATIEAMTASRVNDLVVVPAMLSFLMVSMKNTGLAVPESLKLIITGGDRLNVQLDERVRSAMGVGVLEGYGLTECSPVVCVNPSYSRRKLGTVGPLIPGYEWQLRNMKGEPGGASREGVLWVRGPSVGKEYYKAPELTSERFDNGWFNTGDVVTMDEDGYVSILDRATDIIIVGGFNVYPQEVEAVLNQHSEISAGIAVGMPHPINGEVVKAFVMRQEGSSVTEREIIDYCKKELAHFKVPRKVEFLDSFPLSPTGKILRRKLSEKQ